MTHPRTPDPRAATMTAAEEATPHDAESTSVAPPPSAAEIAALRARLRAVEALLGLPLRPGQPAPPDLPALRRRVAALERHLGLVPGLVPLPGCDGAVQPAHATVVTSEPAGRQGWRERGRAALAAVALLAVVAWLLHPLPGGPGYFPAAQVPARPATGASIAAQTPAEEQPARADYRAQHEGLSPAASAPVAPTGLPDVPRLQPQLAWGDARDNGPAGGAPPPQDDGHNPGPR